MPCRRAQLFASIDRALEIGQSAQKDRETGQAVLQILLDMAKAENRTVVMVTHSPENAAQLDRTVDLSSLRREDALL